MWSIYSSGSACPILWLYAKRFVNIWEFAITEILQFIKIVCIFIVLRLIDGDDKRNPKVCWLRLNKHNSRFADSRLRVSCRSAVVFGFRLRLINLSYVVVDVDLFCGLFICVLHESVAIYTFHIHMQLLPHKNDICAK